MSDNNVCKYCGQISVGGEPCRCEGAKQERKIQDQIEKASAAVETIFGENCSDNGYTPIHKSSISILLAAVEQLANSMIYSITFELPDGVKAKLARGAKGRIKVERSETKKVSTEA